LKKAKELGDILVVGLESVDFVRKIKGKDRLINKQEDRAELLACLEFVDYVVIFDEDTYNFINNIKPDVLVKQDMKTIGNGFAKEIVILSSKENTRIKENLVREKQN